MSATTILLWYENDAGDRWVPPTDGSQGPPEGFCYQHSRFPLQLNHDVLVVVDGHSQNVMTGTSSWSADLVSAMTRPTLLERAKQLARTGRLQGRYSLSDAIVLAANYCEACLNVALHEHGCTDGYPRGSAPHLRSRTSCESCRASKPPQWAPDASPEAS